MQLYSGNQSKEWVVCCFQSDFFDTLSTCFLPVLSPRLEVS